MVGRLRGCGHLDLAWQVEEEGALTFFFFSGDHMTGKGKMSGLQGGGVDIYICTCNTVDASHKLKVQEEAAEIGGGLLGLL